jgi:uncharacterized protein YmfQ (DUF2313 family)
MLAPTYTAMEYLWAFQRLLPRGRIWHRAWGTVQAEQLLTLMPTWARLSGRANDLIVDAFPCSTSSLLPEWEASLGLPDPCTGPLATIQERVAAVCAKFTSRGGQSVDYFIAVCEALGYPGVTIDEFPPTSGTDPGLVYQWRVNIYAPTGTVWFRAGTSAAGEPLASWGSTVLECTLEALKPAHTTIVFAYHDDTEPDQG